MMRRLLFLIGVVFLLWGCGYHLPGQGPGLPGDVQRLHIELFSNETAEPFLENSITNAVIEHFARKRAFSLVEDKKHADAVLEGVVLTYSSRPISYDPEDEIAEYRSKTVCRATLYRMADGKVLWKGDVSWSEEYRSSEDRAFQENSEDAAIRLMSERLAEELYSRITENF